MLSPVAWRTPPRHYGPWEAVVSLLTEGLVRRGHDVTLFATADSETSARLEAVCAAGWEEDPSVDAKAMEALHISNCFEQAERFDIVHNHFDFLPLSYSRLVETPVLTTIHGFSSPRILPVFEKYDGHAHYVSISQADRAPSLTYAATIHHGIDLSRFAFRDRPEDYLLFFGRMHPDKGPKEAIEIARRAGKKLVMAGIVQDRAYFEREVQPHIDGDRVTYLGSVGPEARDRWLGGALCLLHPIAFDEPFGLSVVESMACGAPVVAFDRGSMPELIEDGVTGFLVGGVDDAVAAVGRIGEISRAACRARVERLFSVERMVLGYERAYRAILAGRRCGA